MQFDVESRAAASGRAGSSILGPKHSSSRLQSYTVHANTESENTAHSTGRVTAREHILSLRSISTCEVDPGESEQHSKHALPLQADLNCAHGPGTSPVSSSASFADARTDGAANPCKVVLLHTEQL